MEQFQNITDFSLKSVAIAPLGETDGYEIKQMVNTISYVESITSPFVAATITVADSAGLLADLPIQGGETVKIVVQTSSKEEPEEYVLQVWKVGNRFAKNQTQSFVLGLISVEAINNECTRLFKKIEGKPESVVQQILKEELKTEKEIKSESSQFAIKMLPSNRRPFDIISSISVKSVPNNGGKTPGSGGKESKTSKTKVGGTAGYFFWETKRGYNFFSVDGIINADEVWGPYVEKPANISDGADDRYTISQATFNSEIDIMTSLRKGKYSNTMVFFNHSTGQYSEYHYSVADAYKDMKHLGKQNKPSLIKLGNSGETIADYPTRIISSFLDHESWYNEPGIASFEEKDGSDKPSEYCDFHVHYAAQSLMRYELLKHQQATVIIPGNSEICAGDKIDIQLTNKTPGDRIKDEPYDPESSGVYLISEVTHVYDSTQSTNGRFTTTLRLMRDSYGNQESNHGTK